MNSIPTTSTKSLHQSPGQPVPEAKPLAPVWAGFCSRRPQQRTELLLVGQYGVYSPYTAHLALLCALQAAQPWISELLLSSPPHRPDLVTSHCTEKAVFDLQAKFLLILAFLISNGKSEFYFSRSSIHIINELKWHLLSGISHQKKQFSSSLKTNNKTWVFQGFCCLWNTKILAIAWCKLKADLAKGRWDQFVDFLEQISKCIWMIRQTEQAEQLFLHCD